MSDEPIPAPAPEPSSSNVTVVPATTPISLVYMVIGFAISLACVYFLELSLLVAVSYCQSKPIDPAVLEGWRTTGASFVSFVFGVLVNTKLSK